MFMNGLEEYSWLAYVVFCCASRSFLFSTGYRYISVLARGFHIVGAIETVYA